MEPTTAQKGSPVETWRTFFQSFGETMGRTAIAAGLLGEKHAGWLPVAARAAKVEQACRRMLEDLAIVEAFPRVDAMLQGVTQEMIDAQDRLHPDVAAVFHEKLQELLAFARAHLAEKAP